MIKYIEAANRVLRDVYDSGNQQVKNAINTSDGYKITSLSNLNTVINNFTIPNVNRETNSASCVIFPYFYAAYLYQPTINSGETLINDFKQGNWYIPSIDQLSRVIYYRGYSVSTNFNNSDITGGIKVNISGTTVDKCPIFSKALAAYNNSSATTSFPDAWRNIANDQNITSTTASNANSYTYGKNTNNNSSNNYGWVYGSYSQNTFLDLGATTKKAWRLTPHIGVPFAEFKYSKK